MPPAKRKTVILFALSCGAFFTALIAAFGITFVYAMWSTGQQSNDLEWPMWAIYLAIPLGSALMCYRFLQVAWAYYWTGELPPHNEAHVEGVAASGGLPPAPDAHGTVSSRWSTPFMYLLILLPILILALCLVQRTGIF